MIIWRNKMGWIRNESIIQVGHTVDPNWIHKQPVFGQPPHYKYVLSQGLDSEINWVPTDTEEHYDENMKDDVKRKIIESNGWTKDNIIYKINKQGFRHDGSVRDFFKVEPGGIAYVGDSNFFGIGINQEDVFTHIAHPKELPYINLGCVSSGIETFYRVIKKWVPIVKPRAVFIFHSWANTRKEEYVDTENRFRPNNISGNLTGIQAENLDITTPFDKGFTPIESHITWHKNVEAIKWICHQLKVKVWFSEDRINKGKYNDFFTVYRDMTDFSSRDLMHAGKPWNNKMANHFGEIIHDNI